MVNPQLTVVQNANGMTICKVLDVMHAETSPQILYKLYNMMIPSQMLIAKLTFINYVIGLIFFLTKNNNNINK